MNHNLEWFLCEDTEGKWWGAYSLDHAERVFFAGPLETKEDAAAACGRAADDFERRLHERGIEPMTLDYVT